jgi:uncharacterized membrane protein
MAVPDLARPTKVEAKLVIKNPSNATAVTVVTCPADSVIRVRTIYVNNTTASGQAFNLNVTRNSVAYALISGVTVTAKNLFNAINVEDALYLEPGDVLSFSQVATTAALNLFVSYELVT